MCLHSIIMTIVISSPAGQGRACCTVKYDGRIVAEVLANSRKAAKNAAARKALQELSSN